MPVRIRQTPYTRSGGANVGPYTVFPEEVFAQLGVIAMAGSDQLPGSLGDNPDPADSAYSIVSFDPGPQDTTSAPGRVRQLLKDLVDGGDDVRLMGFGVFTVTRRKGGEARNPKTGKVFARETESLENNTADGKGHHPEKVRAVLREAEKAVR